MEGGDRKRGLIRYFELNGALYKSSMIIVEEPYDYYEVTLEVIHDPYSPPESWKRKIYYNFNSSPEIYYIHAYAIDEDALEYIKNDHMENILTIREEDIIDDPIKKTSRLTIKSLSKYKYISTSEGDVKPCMKD